MPENIFEKRTTDMFTEPVLVVKKGRIAAMNAAAVSLLGDAEGKPVSDILPAHIVNTQADYFVSTARIRGRHCTVKSSSDSKGSIYVLTPDRDETSFGTMMLPGLKSELANLKLAANCVAAYCEENGADGLKNYSDALNRSYYRLKRSVDNMSVLIAAHSGELAFKPEYIDLAELFRGIVSLVSFLTKERGVEITFRSESSVRIAADFALVEQLLLNLLSNSVNHCKPGCRISVALLRCDSGVILSVDDNGSGIPHEELASVLERYSREFRLPMCENGQGLGLSVVRAIAEMHGGTVIIESRGEGRGTSVRVLLSDSLSPDSRFKAGDSEYRKADMITVLTCLADCLPDDAYSGRYED